MSHAINMTNARCPACGFDHIADCWATGRIPGDKAVLWCGSCGYGWQHPLPTPEMIREYYSTSSTYNLHGANEKENASRRRLDRIGRLMPNRGALLDIGCGLGHFLLLAEKDGWDVVGVEPQKSAADYCRKQHKIEVHQGFVGDLDLTPGSFDVVTLWDVLEHVHDYPRFLAECARLAAPGGLLIMAVPNASGWPARIFRGEWRYVMFTHLSYFSIPHIRRAVEGLDLEIVRMDHTMKIQSLIQGAAGRLPVDIDTEGLIRMGRKGSTERGRPEQKASKTRLEKSTMGSEILHRFRRVALEINLARLPAPVGDLMDLYCRKSRGRR